MEQITRTSPVQSSEHSLSLEGTRDTVILPGRNGRREFKGLPRSLLFHVAPAPGAQTLFDVFGGLSSGGTRLNTYKAPLFPTTPSPQQKAVSQGWSEHSVSRVVVNSSFSRQQEAKPEE